MRDHFNPNMTALLGLLVKHGVGKVVLDIGCGSGDTTWWLARHGCHAVGMDPVLTDPASGPLAVPGGGSVTLLRGTVQDIGTGTALGPAAAVGLFGVLHFPGSPEGVTDLVQATAATCLPDAPWAVSWICDDIPLPGAHLPSRSEVLAALAEVRRRPAGWWEVTVKHDRDAHPHCHRVVYSWWRSF